MGKRRKHPPAKPERAAARAWRPDRRTVIRLGYTALVLFTLLLIAQFHYVVPDSAAHIAYARSLLWDRDVDFSNEYRRLGMLDREEGIEFGAVVKETRKPGNPFGMGSAILWLPFLMVTALVAKLFAAGGAEVSTNGFGSATLLAVHLGTWTYALLSAGLMSATLRKSLQDLGSSSRRASLVGALLATPLLFYVIQLPSFSHVCSMFAVALLLFLSLRWREAWTLKRAVLLGVALGLAGLVRAQDLGFWVVPVVIAWWGGALQPRRDWLLIVVYSAAATVVFLPQLFAWSSIYGAPWRVPQGAGFLQFSPGRLWNVMFSSHHGLIAWSPIVAVAIAGWVLMIRRHQYRGLGIALLAGFVIQWFVNSLPYDWWAGWSYGARRFIDCVPLFVIGLAAVAQTGLAGRVGIYVLACANVVQWLRVGSGALSGQGDPGWGELWGKGFVTFLPKTPGSIWEVMKVDWTFVRVLQHADARRPAIRPDPESMLVVLVILWVVGVLATSYYMSIRSQASDR
jgi:hypothetical protein